MVCNIICLESSGKKYFGRAFQGYLSSKVLNEIEDSSSRCLLKTESSDNYLVFSNNSNGTLPFQDTGLLLIVKKNHSTLFPGKISFPFGFFQNPKYAFNEFEFHSYSKNKYVLDRAIADFLLNFTFLELKIKSLDTQSAEDSLRKRLFTFCFYKYKDCDNITAEKLFSP